jgi:hypothetical protein
VHRRGIHRPAVPAFGNHAAVIMIAWSDAALREHAVRSSAFAGAPIHTGKEVHYDGAKDAEVWFLMSGNGPETGDPGFNTPPCA